MTQDNPLSQVDALLQQCESLTDPAARELLGNTLRAFLDLNGDALSRIMDTLASPGKSQSDIVESLVADERIAGVLLLYGLHPQDLRTRVQAALDSVAPYLASHGGSVELVGASDDGAVLLAMHGSCHGCPSSSATLKSKIESAIYQRAPDVTAIKVQEEPSAPASASTNGFVPLERVVASAANLLLQGAAT